jgi:hypothetical protein
MKENLNNMMTEISIPWDKLDKLEAHNAEILVRLASGMKPAECAEMINSINGGENAIITPAHCASIKHKYKETYNLMRGDVLKHIQLQQINGAYQMALDRACEAVAKYQGNGKQGSITETVNAVQCLKKLRDDQRKELEAVSTNNRSASAQAVLQAFKPQDAGEATGEDSGEAGGDDN